MFVRQILAPEQITPAISRFCRDKGFGTPVYLHLKPEQDAKIDDCYMNVARKIAKDGGAILYGWSILEWPKVFLEAIHHAVWVSPNNELIDITPRKMMSSLSSLLRIMQQSMKER